MKRCFDITIATLGLVGAAPILLPVLLLIWLQDFHSPLYIASRVGKDEKDFRMVKLRSMIANADQSGVDSTGAHDRRITKVGRFVRRYKLDELTQLWNVLVGDMSLVGPRPNVNRDVALYTDDEKRLLSIRPGITDIASIVFADEGEILKDSEDPDLDYNQRIRPWKSRLGLLYVEKRSPKLDLQLLALTALTVISRKSALRSLQTILAELGADERLKMVASRSAPLEPYPPPGANEIVHSRAVGA